MTRLVETPKLGVSTRDIISILNNINTIRHIHDIIALFNNINKKRKIAKDICLIIKHHPANHTVRRDVQFGRLYT